MKYPPTKGNMSTEHVERERIIQSLARALYVQHRNRSIWIHRKGFEYHENYGVDAAFEDAEKFIERCEQRERRARRQKSKGGK